MLPAMRRRTQLAFGVVLGVVLVAWVTLHRSADRFDARVAAAERSIGKTTATGGRGQLPPMALEYLARAGVLSNENPRVVRVSQRGEIRRRPDAPWKRFSAVQHLAVRDVGFVWHARMDVGPGVDIEILNELRVDNGSSEVRLLGAIPLSVESCRVPDRAKVQRYLAQLAWAPHAIRDNAALAFKAVGDRTLEVAAGEGPDRVSVELELDDRGDIVRSVAMRPRLENGAMVERRWVAELSRHDRLGAIRIPTYGEARWELPGGRFVYYRGEIESIEFD